MFLVDKFHFSFMNYNYIKSTIKNHSVLCSFPRNQLRILRLIKRILLIRIFFSFESTESLKGTSKNLRYVFKNSI